MDMKKLIETVVDIVKKEWFLIVMLSTIALIVLLFEIL